MTRQAQGRSSPASSRKVALGGAVDLGVEVTRATAQLTTMTTGEPASSSRRRRVAALTAVAQSSSGMMHSISGDAAGPGADGDGSGALHAASSMLKPTSQRGA